MPWCSTMTHNGRTLTAALALRSEVYFCRLYDARLALRMRLFTLRFITSENVVFTSENKCSCFRVELRKHGSEWCLCVSVAISHQLKMGEEHSVKRHEGQEEHTHWFRGRWFIEGLSLNYSAFCTKYLYTMHFITQWNETRQKQYRTFREIVLNTYWYI